MGVAGEGGAGAMATPMVSIPIRILVTYDFMILPQLIDTYHDGILIS
jgi:hypothetical protein